MRIIGGRDFYDGAGHGVDMTTIFLRDANATAVMFPGYELPGSISEARMIRSGPTNSLIEIRESLECIIVLVGGETFPYMIHRTCGLPDVNGALGPDHIDVIRDAHIGIELGKQIEKRRRFDWWNSREREAQLHDFMATPRDKFTTWAIDNKAVTCLIRNARHIIDGDLKGTVMLLNPDCLGDYGFMRIMDPATTHMRITNFITGVLPMNRDLIVITDRDRIAKAGFDKTSFRDWPGKKKPRRRFE